MPKVYDYTTMWGTYQIVFRADMYATNERLAIRMLERELVEDDEYFLFPYAIATVNLPDEIIEAPDRQAFLDTNNLPEIYDFLIGIGAAVDTGIKGTSGYCSYPLVTFTESFIKEIL